MRRNLVTFIVCSCMVLCAGKARAQYGVSIDNQLNSCGALNNGSVSIAITDAASPTLLRVFGPLNFVDLPGPAGDHTHSLTGLPAGFYIVIVQDASNNLVTTAFTISNSTGLSFSTPPVITDNNICAGLPGNGSVQLSVAGGAGPSYTYIWSGPTAVGNVAFANGLSKGTYNVVIKDNGSNCTMTGGPFVIDDPGPQPFTISSGDLSICEGEDFELTIDDTDLTVGGSPVVYEVFEGVANAGTSPVWPATGDGNMQTLSISGLTPGTHTLYVTATAGQCGPIQSTNSIGVTVAPAPAISLGTTPGVCPGVTSANITYSTTTANEYRIDFDGAALAEGFVNVGFSSLAAAPGQLTVAVPPGADPDTYNATLTIRTTASGCTSSVPVVIVVNETPGITLDLSDPAVCSGGTSVALRYSATTGTPDQYTIDFDPAAQAASFVDVINAALTPSQIDVVVPAGAAVGIYNATLTVRTASAGCVSAGVPITIEVKSAPVMSLGADPVLCSGASTSGIAYTTNSGSPDQFSIDFDTAAEQQLFTDVAVTSIPASPIPVAIPAGGAPGSYNAMIRFRDSGSGCYVDRPVVITIQPLPTISGVANAVVCFGSTTAVLAYSSTTNNPDRYFLDFDAAAESDGFVDITDATLLPGAIVISIPGTATSATYNASLTVRNSASGCASGVPVPVQLTINANANLTPGPNPAVCSGATAASLTYSSATSNADEYTLDFDIMAEGQLFADVPATPVPPSPIAISVPSTALAGSYTATLRVNSSATGCFTEHAISITVSANPTISLGPNPGVCPGVTTASLPYSASTADEYKIDFGATAIAEGFTNIGFTALAAAPSQIGIVVPSNASSGTYALVLTIRNTTTGCVNSIPVTVTVNERPGIALDSPNLAVCLGTASVDLTYSAASGPPDQYSIDFDVIAEGAGFTDVANAGLVGSPITIAVPGAAAAGVYNAVVTVRNTAVGCVSTGMPVAIAINPNPTISPGTIPLVCEGTTVADLAYVATASPNQYVIDFDAAAQTAGFVDVPASSLPTTPIGVSVPSAAPVGVYDARIRVSNSLTGCFSPLSAFTVRVGVDINPGVINPVCMNLDAVIPYSGEVGNPDRYSIDYDAAAEASGFVDITSAPLTPGTIPVDVPNGAAGIFNALLSVSNSTFGCSSSQKPVSIVVGSTIAIGALPVACVGSTSTDLTFNSTTGGPDLYSIDFNASAEGAGFADVTGALPVSPVSIAIPVAALPGSYGFSITVTNSLSGCTSPPVALALTVSDIARVDAGADQTICEGVSYLLAGSSVGGAASTGAWSIASQPAGGDGGLSTSLQLPDPSTVSFSANVAGDYVLSLITNDPAGGCLPVQGHVTITVTDVPTVATGQVGAICSNDDLAFEILLTTNSPANTIFNWPDPDGTGGATAGLNVPAAASPHITDRLLNNGAADFVVTYRITPSAGLCVGTQQNVVITVRPSPVLQPLQAKTICGGDAVNYEIRLAPSNRPAGTTLSWPDPDGPLSGTSKLNIPADPAGTVHITDRLYNGSGAPVHVIYSIMATASNGCRAVPRDVNITVNPGAIASAGTPQAICAGGLALLEDSGFGGLATEGTWTIAAGPVSGDGALGFTASTLVTDTVTFSATIAGNYTLRLTTNDPAGSCAPVYDEVVVTVRGLSDPACVAETGNCASVVIVPTPSPATCSNSDGSIVFSIVPLVPALNNTGVRIDIVGTGPTNQTITRTLFNERTFTGLPFGGYNYTVVYGDPSCTKTGTVTIDRSGTVGVPTFSNPVDPVCFGVPSGQVVINVAGESGNPLEWSIDGSTWKPFIAGNVVSGIPGGTNIVSVRRNSGDACASGSMLTLASPTQITASLTPVPATCVNNDGSISLSGVGGGSGPYTFMLNGSAVTPAGNIIGDLAAGSYNLAVTDAAGCSRTFTTAITFPGFVNHTVPVVTPPDCTGGGSNGIISVNITDTGSFEFGITTDPIGEPTTYVSTGGSQILVNNLSNGVYALWVRPVSGIPCTTKVTNIALSGTYAVGFKATNTNIICLNDKAVIELTEIVGAPAIDYRYEVINKLSNTTAAGQISAAQALAGFTISGVEPGDYSLRILQDQSSVLASCTSVIGSAPAQLFVDGPTGVLDTTAVITRISYPDLPTGSATVVVNPSGRPLYEARLELISPQVPGQEYVHDWTPVERDAKSLKFEHTFQELYSGGYELRLIDAMGCEKVYDFSVDVDLTLSVPNIFTPNGDGVNEVFYVRNLPDNARLIVTNRWGKEVYNSSAYANDWNGGDLVEGVYYYQLVLPNESITGWVEVHRGL